MLMTRHETRIFTATASLLALGAGAAFASPSSAPVRLIGDDPVRTALINDAWSPAPVALCFAPGTDPAYMARVNEWVLEHSNPDNPDRYFVSGRWPSGAIGSPVNLSYSFPSDSLTGIGGGVTDQNVLNARMVQWFGSVNAGKAKFRQVFDRWEQLSGARYVEVPDDNAPWGLDGGGPLGGPGPRGDIRIVSINIDGSGGVLAFNFFPTNGDMVLDSSENYGSSGNDFRFFRNVVAHENGHGMGIQHSCPQNGTKLMEPALNLNFDGGQLDDIRAMQKNYGDRFRFNENPVTAGNLGTLSSTPVSITNVSIDINTVSFVDVDWYRFNLPTAATLNISVTPTGITYPNGPQEGSTCTNTGNINALTMQDLAFQVYASDATTVIATASNNPIGQAESITGLNLTNGVHFIRVYSVSNDNDVQMYRLDIAATLAGCPGDTNGDNVVNFQDLSLMLIQWGQCGSFLGADLNGDGCVDFDDLAILLANFGTIC